MRRPSRVDQISIPASSMSRISTIVSIWSRPSRDCSTTISFENGTGVARVAASSAWRPGRSAKSAPVIPSSAKMCFSSSVQPWDAANAVIRSRWVATDFTSSVRSCWSFDLRM